MFLATVTALSVDRIATPATLEEMARALPPAFRLEFGRDPTKEEASWLMAMLRIENANGRAIIQHNYGNVMGRENRPHWIPKWADPRLTVEQLTPREAALRAQGGVPLRFAAFEDHVQGMKAWLHLLNTPRHRRIVEAAGDPEAFHRALTTDHPDPKVPRGAYCPDCKSKATLRSYEKLAAESAAFFEHLKKKSGAQLPPDCSG